MLWETEIIAIDPISKRLTKYAGPNIEAPSPGLAHDYCQQTGLGYCRVTGYRIIQEIPCKPGTHEADWSKAKNYEDNLN